MVTKVFSLRVCKTWVFPSSGTSRLPRSSRGTEGHLFLWDYFPLTR